MCFQDAEDVAIYIHIAAPASVEHLSWILFESRQSRLVSPLSVSPLKQQRQKDEELSAKTHILFEYILTYTIECQVVFGARAARQSHDRV